MHNLTAIIADDEAPLRRFLRATLQEVCPELTIIGEARNGEEALALIEQHWPDIAFLDIRMPGMTGMEVAEKIAGRCRVVFVTAYEDYAVKAFEQAAVDYLLKPVSAQRLQKTAARLKQRLQTGQSVPVETLKHLLTRLSEEKGPSYLQYVRIQQGDTVRLIPVEDVLYFKARDKYTLVMTRDGESLIRKPIKELMDLLNTDQFWQIHRGTIVNIDAVDRVSRSLTGKGVIRLKGRDETLGVSNRYMHRFKQM